MSVYPPVLSQSTASQFLIRHRRANSLFEESKKGNLERECIEELCNKEEAREIFENLPETVRGAARPPPPTPSLNAPVGHVPKKTSQRRGRRIFSWGSISHSEVGKNFWRPHDKCEKVQIWHRAWVDGEQPPPPCGSVHEDIFTPYPKASLGQTLLTFISM